MGLCDDDSTRFLKGVGYNVVRHPNAEIKPLGLIGVQNKEPSYLGPLNLLITNPPGPLPAVQEDVPAADINGKTSSALKIGIGVNIIGSLIGAMGGNLGVRLDYTNARQVQFSYTAVLNDSAVPLEVGNYLRNAEVDAGNLLLEQYVLGNGELFLITKTAKSKKFSVTYERSTGVAAKVDLPVLQGLVGGDVKVEANGANNSVVTFEGKENLVFAFQCFRVGVRDGDLSLTSVKAGGAVFAVSAGDRPVLLDAEGLIPQKLTISKRT